MIKIEKLTPDMLANMTDEQLRKELRRLSHKVSNRAYEIIKAKQHGASRALRRAITEGWVKPSKKIVKDMGITKKEYAKKMPSAYSRYSVKEAKKKGVSTGSYKLNRKQLLSEIAERVDYLNNYTTSSIGGVHEYQANVAKELLGEDAMNSLDSDQLSGVWKAITNFRKKHKSYYYFFNNNHWIDSDKVINSVNQYIVEKMRKVDMSSWSRRRIQINVTRRLNELWKDQYESFAEEDEEDFGF